MEANLAQLAEALEGVIPERECLVWRDRRLTWRDLGGRSRRLARALLSRGLRLHRERGELSAWESGQDHVALYMYNCPEYLEGMLGSFKARLVPINVNYRYVAAELISLLTDARARALIYHASFAPIVAEIRPHLPHLEVLLQVADESGEALLPGAIDYEEALASSSPEPLDIPWSPDDLYVLYTGGTTGAPKGVLWRQADIFVAALGGRRPDGREVASLDDLLERARRGGLRYLPTGPLMHAAHWVVFEAWGGGNTVVLQDETRRLDARAILATAERERANVLLIIGDAFARPLLDELRARRYDLSALKVLGSGGAVLDGAVKQALLEQLPEGVKIIDTLGSSETGTQASSTSRKGGPVETGRFRPNAGSCVLSEDLTRILAPGAPEVGWFALTGRVPLGYLGDRARTERTFPSIDGVRYSVPGDRARVAADGSIELLGRDSVTINSGGEKIFVEEVEQALKRHPAVRDAIVCGRPSERWGNEVAAIVQLESGAAVDAASLVEECRKHLARYKVPKVFVFRDQIRRGANGKADYRWAREQVTGDEAAR